MNFANCNGILLHFSDHGTKLAETTALFGIRLPGNQSSSAVQLSRSKPQPNSIKAEETMKRLTMTAVLLFSVSAFAQQEVLQLYDGNPPGSESWDWQEKEDNDNMWQTRIVYNVSAPTLTVIRPAAGTATGAAVVICPGGGFHALSIDSEGLDVARWLAKRGVTSIVLKYRLVRSHTDNPVQELMTKDPEKMWDELGPVIKMAMADGQTAIRYVRQHAKEYGVNPDRIGIIGFSAGGTVAASVANNYSAESRPDFVAPIYLQYDWTVKADVPEDAPPMFILAASNDQLGLAPHSVRLYNDWTAAGKSAELHLYSTGGHGFGMRKQNLPSDHWIELFANWLQVQGFLGTN
jgi:acetyl esterase/lipase